MRTFFRSIALVAALAGMATADSQVILGKTLVVKDPEPGGNAALRKITAMAKELNSTAIGVGDPMTLGAEVQIIANGANPTQETYVLPPGALPKGGTAGWKAIGSPIYGFLYKDVTGVNGPVKNVLIKKTPAGVFIMKAVIWGKTGHTVNVVPPNPGTDGGMIITLGGGDSYCMSLGGAGGGQVKSGDDKTFSAKATDAFPAQNGGCPALVLP